MHGHYLLCRFSVLVITMMISACNNMLFFPMEDHLVDPADHNIAYQDLYITTENNLQIHGWLLPQKGELNATVLFFHGNGENISTHIAAVYWLVDSGYRVILVDYRGYGKSQGEATLVGAIKDIQHALQYTLDHYSDNKPVIVMGQSLGASMSIYALAKSPNLNRVTALILISPFSDYQEIVRETLSKSWLTWLFQIPLSWTISDDFNPIRYIDSIHPVPVFFIHGSRDELVIPAHSVKLHDKAKSPKQFILIDSGHNDLVRTTEYQQTLSRILNGIAPRQAR